MDTIKLRIPAPPMEPTKPREPSKIDSKPIAVSFKQPYAWYSDSEKEIDIEINMDYILQAYAELAKLMEEEKPHAKVRIVLREDDCWCGEKSEKEYFVSQEVVGFGDAINDNYDEDMEDYQKRMKFYDESMEKYKIKKEEYEKQLIEYYAKRDIVREHNEKIKVYELEIRKLKESI